MLYRFSICRKSPPPMEVQAGFRGGYRRGWRANFGAVQLGFALPLVLPAADRNSSSGNLIPCGAAGLVGWDLQKNQLHGMNTPTNPSPTNLKPQPIPDKTPTTAIPHNC